MSLEDKMLSNMKYSNAKKHVPLLPVVRVASVA